MNYSLVHGTSTDGFTPYTYMAMDNIIISMPYIYNNYCHTHRSCNQGTLSCMSLGYYIMK